MFRRRLSAELGKANLVAVLRTNAVVTLEKGADGFAITESQLSSCRRSGNLEGAFQAARHREGELPLSKLLKAKITLTATLEA